MNKKHFIIGAGVLLLLAAAYYYFFPGRNLLEVVGVKKPAEQLPTAVREDMTTKTATDGSFIKASPIVKDSNGFPLIQGDGSLFKPNKSVKEIQQAINEKYGSSLKLDGIYGPKTAAALNVHGFPAVVYLEDYYEILGI
jgi:hypothetical protein